MELYEIIIVKISRKVVRKNEVYNEKFSFNYIMLHNIDSIKLHRLWL